MEDYLLGDNLSGTRWIGAGSTALGLEGRLQGSDVGEPFYIMGSAEGTGEAPWVHAHPLR